jgi:tRNA(Ile)-lysidine synthase
MKLIQQIDIFLSQHAMTDSPWLLALSGGSDSMALFHSLLHLSKKYSFKYSVAHIDHGWRSESQEEARILQKMADNHQIPFYLKTLDPSTLTGNLEASCRNERYAFFKEICLTHDLKGVLTAHHQGDQAETILKRVLEGSYWMNLPGLKTEGSIHGLKVIRPLLHVSKKIILDYLHEEKISYFNDKTNDDVKFLRAKMRHQMLPWLNESFGKDVQSSLVHLGNEIQEIKGYIEEVVKSYLLHVQRSPGEIHLDLTNHTLHDLIAKSLIRHLCEESGFIPSRQILEQAAQALIAGKAHKKFLMGSNVINIDRQHLFISTVD